MEILLVVFINLIIISSALGILYFFIKKELEIRFREKEYKEKEEEQLALEKLVTISQELRKEIESKLENIQKEIHEKLEKTTEKTAKIEEVARVLENHSLDLRNLKEVLAGTKSRGIFGEKALEEILKDFPKNVYEKQYRLGSFVVDFILKINDTIIPIDSKFPYSSFVKLLETDSETEKEKLRKELIKAIKTHIDNISSKYIIPIRETIEYAIMFLPAEGLFYEILSNKEYDEIWDYAKEKSVIISSPKTFEILCSQLSLILKKQEFARNVQDILKSLAQLEKDINEITSYLEKARSQLSNSTTNLEQAYRAFNRFLFNFKDLIKKEEKLKTVVTEEKEKIKTLL